MNYPANSHFSNLMASMQLRVVMLDVTNPGAARLQQLWMDRERGIYEWRDVPCILESTGEEVERAPVLPIRKGDHA